MDEMNNDNVSVQSSDNSADNGGAVQQSSGDSKKSGLIMLGAAVVLALLSDYIPLPIDDVISIILALIGGKNLFNQ